MKHSSTAQPTRDTGSTRSLGRRAVGRRSVLSAVLAAAALPFAVTACQGKDGATGSESTSATPTADPATLTITPADAALDVRPDAPVTVVAAGGTLTDVTVTAADGTPLAGALDEAGTTWTSSTGLAAATVYAVHAVAANADGAATTTDSTLTTLTPAETAFPAVAPLTGSDVGVGMPIIVTFDSPVADDKRSLVEQGMVVTASPNPVEGSWNWQSASKVEFRPAQYWPARSAVHLDVDLGSVEVSPGVWGKTRDIDFTIGSAMISTVDINAHTLTVTRDGEVINTIPVTLGQSGSGGTFVTRSGTKVIMSLEAEREMNSETTGIGQNDPNYYNVNVKYALRVTNSGEFLHAAPWSVGSQGRANVSHGCTGMSTENAKWMFDNSKVGDVVVYTGSDRTIEPGNGFNVWNETYEQWQQGSALNA